MKSACIRNGERSWRRASSSESALVTTTQTPVIPSISRAKVWMRQPRSRPIVRPMPRMSLIRSLIPRRDHLPVLVVEFESLGDGGACRLLGGLVHAAYGATGGTRASLPRQQGAHTQASHRPCSGRVHVDAVIPTPPCRRAGVIGASLGRDRHPAKFQQAVGRECQRPTNNRKRLWAVVAGQTLFWSRFCRQRQAWYALDLDVVILSARAA